MVAMPGRIFQRFISRVARNDREKTQDVQNADFADQ
jgi:hypothetical protein